MSKYKVGDTITVELQVTEVHPQGLPSGLDEFGRAKNPKEQPNPDVVICEFVDAVEVDAAKRIHLRVPVEA